MSQDMVCLELNRQEAAEVARGETVIMHEEVTPLVMLMTGLDLEELQ